MLRSFDYVVVPKFKVEYYLHVGYNNNQHNNLNLLLCSSIHSIPWSLCKSPA